MKQTFKREKKTVTKYLVELRVVELEVDKESMEDGYMEYCEVDVPDEETLGVFDDYDEARNLFIKNKEQ
tara:strand:+ start:1144 stop:1350 length:207 start_codon:yes stop_codon:yes gene_type:complete